METQATDQPPAREETTFSRRQVALGVLIGVVTYVLILFAVWVLESRPGDSVDLRPISFIIYAALATPMLAITAGAFALGRRGRPLALGLLIGTMAGLIGSMGGCMALL
jgi:hypothetical protein